MLGKIIFIIVAIVVLLVACGIHALYTDPYDFRDWLTDEHGIPLIGGTLALAVVVYLFIFVSWKIMLIIVSCIIGLALVGLIVYGIINAITDKSSKTPQKEKTELGYLNRRIYKVSAKRFNDGYYADSVEVAIKELVTRLKKLVKKYKHKELKELDLFSIVFNNNKDDTLFIAGEDLSSKSGLSEQEGYRFMLIGLWKAFRDPNAHENKQLTKEEAYERLYFVGMLMNKVDDCVKKSNLKE